MIFQGYQVRGLWARLYVLRASLYWLNRHFGDSPACCNWNLVEAKYCFCAALSIPCKYPYGDVRGQTNDPDVPALPMTFRRLVGVK